MLLTEFFRSLCLPDRWSVCGVSVRALSCWHVHALEQLGNAYAFGGQGATLDDAAGMLVVCQHDFESGRRLMTMPNRTKRLCKRMAKRLRRVDRKELHEACMDYSETCRELPEVWQQEGKGGKTMGGPHTWHVAIALMQIGFSESDAWNMPYSRARCYFDVYRESQGACEIMSERQRALLKQAELAANGGVKC